MSDFRALHENKMSLSLKKIAQKPLNEPELTENEVAHACSVLNAGSYRAVERSFVDPGQAQQNVALFSFLPCEGATPNRLGIFGFAKVRGVYATEKEANDRAVYLIRKIDSVNKIHHVRVGQSFPLGSLDFQEKWTESVNDEKDAELEAKMTGGNATDKLKDLIDYNDEFVDEVGFTQGLVDDAFCDSFCIAKDKESERDRKARESVLKRQKQLLEDVKCGPSHVDQYITERNKFASVATRYQEREAEMLLYRDILKKSFEKMKQLETPEILDTYREIYEKTLEECGVNFSDPAGQKVRKNFETLPVFDFIK
jgi:hypothetical protein